MKDNNKSQRQRAKAKDIINIAEPEEQPEQPKEEQEEFVRVSDSRSGLHISLGSTTIKVSELLSMTLWLKDNWNNPKDKTKGEVNNSYLG